MTVVRSFVLRDTYRDSVYLMKLSSQAKSQSGAVQVSAMMGTPRNKELFTRTGLMNPEIEAARPDDLVVAIEAEENKAGDVLAVVEKLLHEAPPKKTGTQGAESVNTLEKALASDSKLNLALISVAGDYARYEAIKAVSAGMDVMLYSDNISLDDEIAIKELARRKGLMVMGPDCGTAFIDGVPLAFANAVKPGPVGLVAASGTGLQEVMCLLDRMGVGIRQAYGTGGRDLKDEVGGITALTGLARLAADPLTKIIAIIGKPPGMNTRNRLAEGFQSLGKPVFVHYLGADNYKPELAAGATVAHDLTELAALVADSVLPGASAALLGDFAATSNKLLQGRTLRKGFVRGLFGGGTLCQEAAELAGPQLAGDKFSNLKVKGFQPISGSEKSRGHCFWDFGEDEFTVGRPHPMMAPELKMERLVAELCDPEVAVVLMDMVIGFGSHPDQANLALAALDEAHAKSGGKSAEKLVIVSVCGTDGDTPSRKDQVALLEQKGLVVLASNAQAAHFAAKAVQSA